jgi:hypothetical protein
MVLAALAGHMALHGSWIVDDAGITFAYARNVAEGHGFVAHPGSTPVEGFTNLLWLLLLVPLLDLHVFDPVWMPKLIGLLCAGSALLLLRRVIWRTFPLHAGIGDLGLAVVALNPAFAIWCASGLENGLHALLVAWLLAASARATTDAGVLGVRSAIGAGLLAFLAAATRPDGLVFAALWPATVLAGAAAPMRRRLALAAAASAVTIAAVTLLTAWRWHEFGDIVPNTFHAKVGGDTARARNAVLAALVLTVAQLLRWRARARSPWLMGSVHAAVVVVTILCLLGGGGVPRGFAGGLGVALVAVAFALAGRRPVEATAPWAFGSILALLCHGALPPDWMGEYRFATPFLVIATPWVVLELGAARDMLAGNRRHAWDVLLLVLASVVLVRATTRTLAFREQPPVPMSDVEAFQRRIAGWADELAVPDASVLTPDVGGALWLRRLRVIDLAGLCDAEIARLIGDPQRLAECLLARKPTFVTFHGNWAVLSGLPGLAAFERDYVPIAEAPDPLASRIAGRMIASGVYVRRAHAPDARVLERWRKDLP